MTEKLIDTCPAMVYRYKLTQKRPLIVEIPDRHGEGDVSQTIEKYVSDQKAMRLRLSRQEKFTGYGVDMTSAGQEVTTVSATETETADTQNSEETDEKEIYVGF